MSRGTAAWTQVAVVTGVAVALLLAVSPPVPAPRLAWPAAIFAGGVLGAVLFVLMTRGMPLRRAAAPTAALSVRCWLLGLLAVDEEIVWRRVLLGELMFAGVLAALAGSTLAFALAHRARPDLHLLTGAAFGGVYLATGALGSSIAAHWAYNVLVGWGLTSVPERDRVPP